jgi:hypothetical protein
MAFETHTDDYAFSTGTHEGADGATSLYVKNGNFDVLVNIGVDCHNDTQVTNGAVTAVTHNTVTATGVTWDNGDTYSIYCTTTKDSSISSFRIDKTYGRKLTQVYSEEYPDNDIPGDEFGPGQPSGSHR